MKSLAFIDLQNTLVHSLDKFSEETLAKIKKIEKNYHLCLATTSFHTEVKEFLESNGLKWDYIADGGAYLSLNSRTYTKCFKIPKERFLKYEDDILFFFYENKTATITYKYQERLKNIYPKTSIRQEITLNEVDNTFTELIICLNRRVKDEFMDNLRLSPKVIIEDQNISLIRIIPEGINKGYFMDFVREYYNIPFDKTIGFGDSLEDLATFNKVKIKVAMQNAEPPLKALSDYQIPGPDHEGVIKFLFTFNDASTL